jgi:hypothetical protein
MRRLFREPAHRPSAVIRIALGLLLGDALRISSRPLAPAQQQENGSCGVRINLTASASRA